MSRKYLGDKFDIHGGGSDLIFPHHENEIAQAEAASGQPFACFWLHNGFVTVNDEKMSKSLGNFFVVRDLLQEWAPEILRFFLLSTQYRSPLDYNLDNLATARKGYNRLKNTVELLDELLDGRDDLPAGSLTPAELAFRSRVLEHVAEFEEAMDDDFNTALGLASLHNLAREINSFVNKEGFEPGPQLLQVLRSTREQLMTLLGVLGLVPGENRQLGAEYAGQLREIAASAREAAAGLIPDNLPSEPQALLGLLLAARVEARKQKNYALSDQLRDQLKAVGIILEDTPRGSRWRLV